MRPRTPEEEGAVYDPDMEYSVDPDMVYSDEEEETVEVPKREMTTDRSKEDILDDKIAELEEKHRQKQLLADKKQTIRDKKSQIRRLQYSPVYKGAELVAGGIKKTVDNFTGNDKTPEEKLVSMQKKQMRKEKMQRFMKSMEKFGDTSSYDMGYGNTVIVMGDGKTKKPKSDMVNGGKSLDFFGNGKRNDMFIGSKKKGLDMLGSGRGLNFVGGKKGSVDFFGKSNLLNTSKKTKSKKKNKSKKNKMRLM